ncbi:MAG: DUF2029 domain-containing protein [Planctomycetes bacterium]|nr:DUF2029 domain-containing protein [Planctomycetota bacterium]
MKRSSLWLLPLLLAAMVGGAFYFDRQAQKGDRELGVYVTGGERMADGVEIYRRGTDGKPFTYPPFAAVPFVAFARLPDAWHPAAWFVVNFLILIGIVRWLHRWAGRDGPGRAPPRMWWFWIPTAVFGGRHVVSVFTNQSHDLTILGLVTLTAASWCSRRRIGGVLAAFWAGLGAATKATPLIFAGLFLLRARWLALAALVVTTVGATLLPDHVFPRASETVNTADQRFDPDRFGGGRWWRAWYDVNLAGLEVGGTAEASGAWNSHSVLNQSLSGALRRLLTPVEVPDGSFVVGDKGHVLLVELSPSMVRVVTLAASALVLGLIALGVLFAARAVRAAGGAAAAMQRTVGLGEVAAFACGMVLLSPQSSKSHFCVWLLPVAFVVDHLVRRRRDWLALLLFVAALVLGMLSKGLLGRADANVVLAYGSVAGSTLLLLLATVRCLQQEARASAASAAPVAPAPLT